MNLVHGTHEPAQAKPGQWAQRQLQSLRLQISPIFLDFACHQKIFLEGYCYNSIKINSIYHLTCFQRAICLKKKKRSICNNITTYIIILDPRPQGVEDPFSELEWFFGMVLQGTQPEKPYCFLLFLNYFLLMVLFFRTINTIIFV